MLKHRINPDYINAAMQSATFKELADNEGYFGSIPGFQGVWANEATLEACRAELESALEDWLDFSLTRDLPVPTIQGISLLSIE